MYNIVVNGIQLSELEGLIRRGCKSYLESRASLFVSLAQQLKKWRLRKGNRLKRVQVPILRAGGRAKVSTLLGH